MLEQCLGAKDVKGNSTFFSRVKASCFAYWSSYPRPSIPATSYNRACCMINSYICSALSECTVCMSLPLADLIPRPLMISWYQTTFSYFSELSQLVCIAMALPTIAPESPTGVRRQAASVAAVTRQGTVWLHKRCQIFGAAQPTSKCGDTVHWSNVLERNTRFVMVLTCFNFMKHQSTKCIKMYQAMVDDYDMMHFSISFVRFFFLLPSFGVRKKVKQTRFTACTGWRWSWWNGLQGRTGQPTCPEWRCIRLQ